MPQNHKDRATGTVKGNYSISNTTLPPPVYSTAAAIVDAVDCRAQAPGGFAEPPFIDLVGFVGVDKNIAVLVVGTGLRHPNLLVPAVLPADEIRPLGKCQVLVYPAAPSVAYYPPLDRAGSYFSTSACSGNWAVLPLADLRLDFDAVAGAVGAGSFMPVSWKSTPFCEKRNRFPLWSAKNCGSSTVK